MGNKKVLLITPPYHCGVVEVAGTWIPLTLCYLAGAVRKAGYQVEIYDAMSLHVGFDEIREKCRQLQPDFVGVTAITATTPDAILTAKTAKEARQDTVTILGGVHPTFMDREVLETSNGAVDWVLRGEAELTLPKLLDEICCDGDPFAVPGTTTVVDGEVKRGLPWTRPDDLDALEPAFDLLDWSIYTYFVEPGSRLGAVSTSRGCNQACTFCSQQKFTAQTWRCRDPIECAKEVAMLHDTYGVDIFLITDELPTVEQDRWLTFLEEKQRLAPDVKLLMETRASDIVRDKDFLTEYKKAGIVHIYVGAEAVDQETLNLINKDLSVDDSPHSLKLIRDHGMITETSFVLGLPDETPESIAHTLKMSIEFNPDFAHYLAIAPWPYADMYPDLEPHIEEWDYRHYNLVDPVVKPKNMTRTQVDKAIVDCYRKFYHAKMTEITQRESDPYRKDYILKAMKLIMHSSFITSKMGVLGLVPKAMEAMMKGLNKG